MPQSIINLSNAISGIEKWKKDRHLDTLEQREGYLINILEELGELVLAYREDDDDQIIDALCDIFVFTINAYPTDFNKLHYTESAIANIRYHIHMLAKQVISLSDVKTMSIFSQRISTIYNTSANIANILGYEFDKCLIETVKEISSRTGTYDSRSKKWIKDVTAAARAKWYKADYKSCKYKREVNMK